ncbi:MAG: inositol monophosphatase [Opitutaceae bacterium]|nr:inositol monophosphatase [Cytophagales bacterium]
MNLEVITKRLASSLKEAGGFIRKEFETFSSDKIEKKGRYNNLVSYVDKQAEEMLVESLTDIFPDAGFVTEENTTTVGRKEYNWIIDPLDGTTNFMHGLPIFCTTAALMKGDEVLSGVVLDPMRSEVFYAWKGGGAWLNNTKLQVSQVNTVEDSLIITGFPYDLKGQTEKYYALLQKFTNRCHGVRRLGSAALDMAYVASGRGEAFFEYNLNIWDIAAGILLVEEAGGKVTDFSGGNKHLTAIEVLAAGKAHEELLKVIKGNW